MLTVFTIVLNGEPWIRRILPELQKLDIPWRWVVVEGVSLPRHCTSHCREVQAHWHDADFLSVDGTRAYLDEISAHARVRVLRQPGPWEGKVAMIRAALAADQFHEAVVELDADELFTAPQLTLIHSFLVGQPVGTFMQFACDFYFGPRKKVITTTGFGSQWYEWYRAWRFGPGVEFVSHEPPRLNVPGSMVPRGVTQDMGLVLDHRSFVTAQQARFKEEFYGWPGFYEGWRLLQETTGPVRLKKFMAYATENAVVDDV
jgi:hypothetical protein